MEDKKFYKTFLQDSQAFLENLDAILLELEKEPHSIELVNHAFRNIHSLKSEASYLGQTEITSLAHQMESCLENIRERKQGVSAVKMQELFFTVDKIKEIVSFLLHDSKHSNVVQKSEAEKDVDISHDNTINNDGLRVNEAPEFSDFEKRLIREALEREERFYRLIFEIETTFPMKYAKAYLVLCNLEVLVNVIKTIPSFDNEGDDKYERICIYFTGTVPEKEIYRAVNVDQVNSIQIAPIAYESFLPELRKSDASQSYVADHAKIAIHMDGEKVDQLIGFVDELKIKLYQLKRDTDKENKKLISHIDLLRELTGGLEALTKDISMVTLNDAFSHFHRFVRDLSKSLNKEADLRLEGCDIQIDRGAGEIIADIIIHLIRNAIDHGIEYPEEREKSGKTKIGTISVKAEQGDDNLIVMVSDDGKGVQKEALYTKAEKMGLVDQLDINANEQDLLSLMVHPGLTTKQEATDHSGRGVGLDLVFQKIRQFEHGEFSVITEHNKGTQFKLSIPGGFTLITLQIVQCGSKMIAIPARSIEKQFEVNKGHYTTEQSGAWLLQGLPVFSITGRVYATDKKPQQQHALLLHYLGSKGIFLVDEVLFKKDMPEDKLTLFIEESPYIYKVSFGKNTTDFIYLNPSIIIS